MNDLTIRPTTPGMAAAAVDQALAREGWKISIVKEIQARGATPEDAHHTFDTRAVDFERCRRNNMTPAQAVTNVIGGWAQMFKSGGGSVP